MLVIGLTGGIASGKSTAAKFFSKLNVPIIDADIVARELTYPKKIAHKKIVARFGPEILDKKNKINRRKLRLLIFKDHHQKSWLEKMLHPLIIKEIIRQIKKTTAPYCIIVAPLLLEAGGELPIHRILVIEAQKNLQIRRAEKRDKTKSHHIEKIIKTQALRKERLALADDIIFNTHSFPALKKKIEELHHFYLSLANKPKIRPKKTIINKK
jgi:dephospho-CoA kinase